eukprot:6197475-Pleurochrysis_carterae.AAC.1
MSLIRLEGPPRMASPTQSYSELRTRGLADCRAWMPSSRHEPLMVPKAERHARRWRECRGLRIY